MQNLLKNGETLCNSSECKVKYVCIRHISQNYLDVDLRKNLDIFNHVQNYFLEIEDKNGFCSYYKGGTIDV